MIKQLLQLTKASTNIKSREKHYRMLRLYFGMIDNDTAVDSVSYIRSRSKRTYHLPHLHTISHISNYFIEIFIIYFDIHFLYKYKQK